MVSNETLAVCYPLLTCNFFTILQWYDALRAVARLPKGLPHEFRKSVWLSLANRHIKHLKLDWPKTVRFTFNDRSNPDDDTLGVQIVKVLRIPSLEKQNVETKRRKLFRMHNS